MAATVNYEFVGGSGSYSAILSGSGFNYTQTHISAGAYSFLNVADDIYVLRIIDSKGCLIQKIDILVDCGFTPTTTTTTSTSTTTSTTSTSTTTEALKEKIFFAAYPDPLLVTNNNTLSSDGTYWAVNWNTNSGSTQVGGAVNPLSEDVILTITVDPNDILEILMGNTVVNINNMPTFNEDITSSGLTVTLPSGETSGYFSFQVNTTVGSSTDKTFLLTFVNNDIGQLYNFGLVSDSSDSNYETRFIAATTYGYENIGNNYIQINGEIT